jgi:hypothetical protein
MTISLSRFLLHLFVTTRQNVPPTQELKCGITIIGKEKVEFLLNIHTPEGDISSRRSGPTI